MDDKKGAFLVDLTTRAGRVCERYETYEEARKRVDQFPPDSIVGLAYIFQELADGSERLVRDDGKALQYHRRVVEESKECPDEPLPLTEESLPVPEGRPRIVELRPPDDGWDDDLPLV